MMYLSAMNGLKDIKAGLAGYVDRPRSSILIRMLHLLDIPVEEVSRARSRPAAGWKACTISPV